LFRTKPHVNHALVVQGLPEFFGPPVWQGAVRVLAVNQGKLANGQKDRNEPWPNMEAVVHLYDLPVLGHAPAVPAPQSVREMIPGPRIVLADVHRAVCTFAGVERPRNESEDAADPGPAVAEVIVP